MRTLKFRAWEKPGFLLSNTEGTAEFKGKMHNEDDWKFWGYAMSRPEEYDLMQWTWFKDRFDTSIFEGDIVKTENDLLWQVKFGEWKKYDLNDEPVNSFGFYLECLKEFNLEKMQTQFYKGIRIEVIGNIYEKPELLPDAD